MLSWALYWSKRVNQFFNIYSRKCVKRFIHSVKFFFCYMSICEITQFIQAQSVYLGIEKISLASDIGIFFHEWFSFFNHCLMHKIVHYLFVHQMFGQQINIGSICVNAFWYFFLSLFVKDISIKHFVSFLLHGYLILI